jgi:hypothetical protein
MNMKNDNQGASEQISLNIKTGGTIDTRQKENQKFQLPLDDDEEE